VFCAIHEEAIFSWHYFITKTIYQFMPYLFILFGENQKTPLKIAAGLLMFKTLLGMTL